MAEEERAGAQDEAREGPLFERWRTVDVVYRRGRFCIEASGCERVFFLLNGVLTFAADQQAVLGTVLEQITCAESDGRRDRRSHLIPKAGQLKACMTSAAVLRAILIFMSDGRS